MDTERTRSHAEGGVGVAALMAMIFIFAMLFAGTSWEKARNAVPKIPASSDRPLTLTAAPGDEVSFMITGPVLGKARWASDSGFHISLAGDKQRVVSLARRSGATRSRWATRRWMTWRSARPTPSRARSANPATPCAAGSPGTC